MYAIFSIALTEARADFRAVITAGSMPSTLLRESIASSSALFWFISSFNCSLALLSSTPACPTSVIESCTALSRESSALSANSFIALSCESIWFAISSVTLSRDLLAISATSVVPVRTSLICGRTS